MCAAIYVGRVGGLAVALGVGFAVVTGQGVAQADTSDTDSSSTSSSESADATDKRETAKPSGSDPTPRDENTEPDLKPDTGPTAPVSSKPDESQDKNDQVRRSSSTRYFGSARTSRRTVEAEAPEAPEPKAVKRPARTVEDVVEKDTKPVAEPAFRTTRAVETTQTIETAVQRTSTPTPAEPSVAPVARMITRVLSSVGLTPSAPAVPTAPQQSSLLLALAAMGTRREVEARPLSSQATAAPLAAAAVTTPATTRIGWLTGANSINETVKRFGIAGTDVGVMWDNGVTKDNPATSIVEQRQVLIAFGDTFSGAGMSGVWRNNVLLRSADNVLGNGLYVPNGIIHDPGAFSGSPMTDPNFAREIIGKYGYAVGSEVTIIPTAAIAVAGAGANGATRQYVNFMSVRSWDTPGKWTTNYSGIIWSDDNGQNWRVVPSSSIRPATAGRSTMPFVSGNQNFQQGAYVRPAAGSADAAAGWVYSYGTPAGRSGTIFVSRVNEKQLLDQTKYEYWNGTSWVKNKPSAATPVLPGTTTSSFFGLVKTTTYPSAGEMSVQYNPYLKKYVMLYTDSGNNVVMRTSATPQGTWSTAKTLVTSSQYPGLYAPMIHPWSGSTLLKKADGAAEDPQMLYWNLSQYNEYNVALMRTDLSRV
ncbi:DUF4185 domain-containing protein [Mycolicibacterium mengxianglii]|uniref:DUF4185 domain-containing protein n=1 Tax=Mycolicibacterium mengxianglii TaxID=2736649 RepID=UPI0018D130D7|nr:DUF4185 domain-containing protein [Mycolicibacterium mengxianglii]